MVMQYKSKSGIVFARRLLVHFSVCIHLHVCVCMHVCVVNYVIGFSCAKVSHPSNAISARPGHPSGKAATVRQRVPQLWYGGRARQKILMMMMMIGKGAVGVYVCAVGVYVCAVDELEVQEQWISLQF